MSAEKVFIHLRNTKCSLLRLAEHYQKALLTYYVREVKNSKTPLCILLMASSETPLCISPRASKASCQNMQSCPAYESISPIITDMRSNKLKTNNGCDKNDISDSVSIDKFLQNLL